MVQVVPKFSSKLVYKLKRDLGSFVPNPYAETWLLRSLLRGRGWWAEKNIEERQGQLNHLSYVSYPPPRRLKMGGLDPRRVFSPLHLVKAIKTAYGASGRCDNESVRPNETSMTS